MQTILALRQKPLVQIPALLLTLGLMWLLPFLVHLLPLTGPVPMGARLLPIFYAPLLAAWLFHPAVGLIASLLMPFINHAFTGMPTLQMSILLGLELVIFSLVLQGFRRRSYRFALAAPLGFLAAKTASALVLWFLPILPVSPLNYLGASIINAWPGLLVFLALNLVIVQLPHEQ